MRCVEDECGLDAKGYDIEKAYDEEDQAIYAVTYECPEGHRFVAEYEREPGQVIEEEELEEAHG